jgi:hypothetical protein
MYNIYEYFAVFMRAAKKAGWSQERIAAVLEDARSSDYEHAMSVLLGAWHEAMDECREKEEIVY